MSRVLVACEYSGIVRDAFLARGHDAMSCDLLPTDAPGPHYQGDMFDLDLSSYDLVIAHPPCTALCVSGNRHYAGSDARRDAADFIWRIWTSGAPRLAIENPVGVINTLLPDMPRPIYIQPWEFGHGETKKTGLWLRGLPPLIPTNIVDGREQRVWRMAPSPERWKVRSITYAGIAEAMAVQWGSYVESAGDSMSAPICQQCSGPLEHPTEIRENLCVHCYFNELNAIEALPPSDYWQLDMATQDMLDSRQQTEMSGER